MSTTRIRIGPADHGRRMTLEEFREADEEPGYRYELARGVLEVTEVPNDPHWQVVEQPPSDVLARYQAATPRPDPPDRRRRRVPGLDPRDGLRAESRPRGRVQGDAQGSTAAGSRPASSPRSSRRRGEVRDYQTKREEYLAFGVREYWIVDPQRRQVTVLDPPGRAGRTDLGRTGLPGGRGHREPPCSPGSPAPSPTSGPTRNSKTTRKGPEIRAQPALRRNFRLSSRISLESVPGLRIIDRNRLQRRCAPTALRRRRRPVDERSRDWICGVTTTSGQGGCRYDAWGLGRPREPTAAVPSLPRRERKTGGGRGSARGRFFAGVSGDGVGTTGDERTTEQESEPGDRTERDCDERTTAWAAFETSRVCLTDRMD